MGTIWKLGLVSIFFLLSISGKKNSPPKWLVNFEEAKHIAQVENKKILLYFTGSDWCPPCIKLKQDFFVKQDFIDISSNYTLVYIDIPRNRDLISKKQYDHNMKLLSEFNKKKVFPLMVVARANGKVLDSYSGYGMNGDFSHHLNFLKKNQ